MRRVRIDHVDVAVRTDGDALGQPDLVEGSGSPMFLGGRGRPMVRTYWPVAVYFRTPPPL